MQQGSVKAGSNFGPEVNVWPWYFSACLDQGSLQQ